MRAYILGRLVSIVPVLFGVSIVIFLLMKLIPGDAAQVLWLGRALRVTRSS